MSERVVWGLILRTVGLLLLVAAVCVAVWRLADLVLLVTLAAVLATGLARISATIERIPLPPHGWTLPPVVTVLLVYVVLIAAIIFGAWQLAAPAVQQTDDLARRLPTLIDSLDQQLEQITGQPHLLQPLVDSSTQLNTLREQVSANAGRLLGFASGAFGIVTSTLFTLVIALYMTIDGERLREGLLAYLPADRRPLWRDIMIEAGTRVSGWLIGQVILSLSIFVVTAIGLFALGMPYALGLALVAGVLEVLPILGPPIAGVIATIVALTVDWTLALKVIALYVVIQQLENNLLVPRIIGQASGLHPLVVMLVLLIGSSLFGLIGAILSVPVATALHVAITHLRNPEREPSEPDDLDERAIVSPEAAARLREDPRGISRAPEGHSIAHE